MKKHNDSPIIYILLLCLALGSLAFTTVSAVRATPSTQSELYTANMNTSRIGVTLQEKTPDSDEWNDVAYRNFDGSGAWDPAKGEKGTPVFSGLQLSAGDEYLDDFRVLNSGTIDEYVRVIVYKYWLAEDPQDEQMEKDLSLDARYIQVLYSDSGNWLKDTVYSTSEKEIWYYALPLAAAKEAQDDTPAVEAEFSDVLIKGLMLDGEIKKAYTADEIVDVVEDEDGVTTYTTITYDYAYNGRSFKIILEVDGVQARHGQDAITSAWGRKVEIADDGQLQLK